MVCMNTLNCLGHALIFQALDNFELTSINDKRPCKKSLRLLVRHTHKNKPYKTFSSYNWIAIHVAVALIPSCRKSTYQVVSTDAKWLPGVIKI